MFKNVTDEEKLNQLHEYYQKRIGFIGIPEENRDSFIWSDDRKINIYFIEVSETDSAFISMRKFVIFAKPSSDGKNHMLYMNKKDKTNSYWFEKNPYDAIGILEKLISSDNELKLLISKINQTSLTTARFMQAQENWINSWINNWVDKEYEAMSKNLSTTKSPIIKFSDKKFFIDRYHFDEMLKNIKDEQFWEEFRQVMIAYEQGLWFVCAAALGSTIEYLMYLTIKNYNKPKLYKTIGTNPTVDKYMRAFRIPPISINMRQENFIRAIFKFRNSVSHYNSGYTSKQTCNIMLDGLSSIYNDFYLKSLEYTS